MSAPTPEELKAAVKREWPTAQELGRLHTLIDIVYEDGCESTRAWQKLHDMLSPRLLRTLISAAEAAATQEGVREALEPFAKMGRNPAVVKGKPDDCWCGQAPDVIRYSDLHRAASVLTQLAEGGAKPSERR